MERKNTTNVQTRLTTKPKSKPKLSSEPAIESSNNPDVVFKKEFADRDPDDTPTDS